MARRESRLKRRKRWWRSLSPEQKAEYRREQARQIDEFRKEHNICGSNIGGGYFCEGGYKHAGDHSCGLLRWYHVDPESG